jgi:hypothetical protein
LRPGIGAIARHLGRVADLDDDTLSVVDRAAELAKFDLATQTLQ